MVDFNLGNFPIKWGIHVDWSCCRGGVWPCKNHKYVKKRKLDVEFQIFFLFDILLQKIHSDIKVLYNFVNNMHKILDKKKFTF